MTKERIGEMLFVQYQHDKFAAPDDQFSHEAFPSPARMTSG